MAEQSGRFTTYDRDEDDAVRDKVVVQRRKVNAATRLELEGSLRLHGQRASSFDDIEEILLLLPYLVAQSSNMFDDVSRPVEARRRRDIMKRSVLG